MIFTLEALKAKHGDALLLHWGRDDLNLAVIDGGPSGVYTRSLRPRLDALRASRAPNGQLPIRLLMVSHIDDDHVRGVLDLTSRLRDLEGDNRPLPYRIETLWHNSFDDIVGGGADAMFRAASAGVSSASTATVPDGVPLSRHGWALVASVKQGRDLRNDATALSLPVNARPGAAPGALLVGQTAGDDPVDLGDGVSLRLLAPDAGRVEALQREWDAALPDLLGAAAPAARAEAAAYVDSSVANLASLVALVEASRGSKRRRLLLTGDARGDDILAGAERAGLLSAGKLKVNLLKLPHHGSDRNVETDFFRAVTADHYVVSGDGRHHNPELATFEMLIAARGDARYTIHLTYPWDEYRADYPADELKRLFEHHQAAGRRFEVRVPEAGASSVRVDLLDEYDGS